MKTTALLAAGVIASITLFAQDYGERHHPGRRGENLTTILSLDEKQQESLEQLNEKYSSRRAELRTETREEMRALELAREKELETVLTPDQKKKWAAYQSERDAHRKEMTAEHQEHMKLALLLSSDQATRMNAAHEWFRKKMDQVVETRGTSGLDRAKIDKITSEHRQAVKSILNEEQFKKWERIQAGPGPHGHGHGKQHHGSHEDDRSHNKGHR